MEKLLKLRKMLPEGAINEIATEMGVSRNWTSSIFGGKFKSPDEHKFIEAAERKIEQHIGKLQESWKEYQGQCSASLS